MTAWAGDPDVAVGAADTAVRMYLAWAGEINADLGQRALHLPLFVLAARLAALVHGAFGRVRASLRQLDDLGRA